jgi:hypothetical protein
MLDFTPVFSYYGGKSGQRLLGKRFCPAPFPPDQTEHSLRTGRMLTPPPMGSDSLALIHALTRPSGTLSPTGGEGWAEEVHGESPDELVARPQAQKAVNSTGPKGRQFLSPAQRAGCEVGKTLRPERPRSRSTKPKSSARLQSRPPVGPNNHEHALRSAEPREVLGQ